MGISEARSAIFSRERTGLRTPENRRGYGGFGLPLLYPKGKRTKFSSGISRPVSGSPGVPSVSWMVTTRAVRGYA